MDDDFAIIIGLQNYPGLDDSQNGRPPLSGPENDARGFKDWAASPEGGDVPEQNIKLILSSDYPEKVMDFSDAKPTTFEIARAFEKLRRLSEEKQKRFEGSKIGRRLYIYMSGHGISPTPFGTRIEKEAGLLMANVDPTNIASTLYHIPGIYTATWFCENDCFDEVFLFMDCCRDIKIVSSSNNYLPNRGNATNTTRFYAFAAKWSRRAREREIDGKMQGIFTKTLLSALGGACADPDPAVPGNGIITGSSLKSYLFQNMKEFVDPQFANEVEDLEPDIDYSPKVNEGKNILIKRTPGLQKFPVLVNVPGGINGDVRVLYNGTDEVAKKTINNSPLQLEFSLPRGSYTVIAVAGDKSIFKVFNVKGIETTLIPVIVDL